MPKKEPLQKTDSVCFTNLRLTLWERPFDGAKWGVSITDEKTNEVLVKTYAASEEEAIGDAGYKLYTGFFSNKKLEQVRKSAIGSKKKNGD